MINPLWQLRFGDGELLRGSEAGVFAIACDFVSLSKDTATLTVDPDLALAYGSTVEIHYAGSRIFLGRVQVSRLIRNGQDKRRVIPLLGPWWYLQRIGFRQTWMLWSNDALGQSPASRVILNQAASGGAMGVADQLSEIVTYARSRGAPLQFGAAEIDLSLPYDEQRDLTCEQAIQRCLRFTPAVCSWIDYAPAIPTIYFGQGSPVAPLDCIESDDTSLRDDLVCPGLTIEIERINTSNGAQYRTLDIQRAGDTDAVEALFCTLPLAGMESNATMLQADVETEDIPDPLSDAQYWIDRHSRLQGVAPADLTFIQATRYLEDGKTMVSAVDAAKRPRRALTPMAQMDALGLSTDKELWIATVDIIKRDALGNIKDQEHAVILEFPVVTTDAITKTYKRQIAYEGIDPEPCPPDLAVKLLAHWSVLYAQGSAVWPMALSIPPPGARYGDTMSPLQSVSVDSGQNSVNAVFGPPRQLEIADFATRLQGFRTRRAALSFSHRTTGTPGKDTLDATTTTPTSGTGHAPGDKRRTKISAPDGRSIDLNPSAIDAGKSIGVNTLTIKSNGETLASMQVLSTSDMSADLVTASATATPGSSAASSTEPCPWCPRRWDGSVTAGGDGDGSVIAGGGGIGDTPHPGVTNPSLPGVGATDVLHPSACPPCQFVHT
jgi:hypothetical protein